MATSSAQLAGPELPCGPSNGVVRSDQITATAALAAYAPAPQHHGELPPPRPHASLLAGGPEASSVSLGPSEFAARPRKKERDELRIRAIEDEHLMRLMMRFRPFGTKATNAKQAAWQQVVDAYNESLDKMESVRGQLQSTSSAQRRVSNLVRAIVDDKRAYHMNLSPAFHEMLLEYTIHSGTRALTQEQTMAAVEQSSRPSESASTTAGDGQSTPEQIAENVAAAVSGLRASARSEVVFRVALEMRPFCASVGSRRDHWDAVAVEANKQLGLATFKNGSSVQSHIRRVLSQLRANAESFPAKIRELSAQYSDEMSKVSSLSGAAIGRPMPQQLLSNADDTTGDKGLPDPSPTQTTASTSVPTSANVDDLADNRAATITDDEEVAAPDDSPEVIDLASGDDELQAEPAAPQPPRIVVPSEHALVPTVVHSRPLIETTRAVDSRVNSFEHLWTRPRRFIVHDRDTVLVRTLLDVRPFWAHTTNKQPMWDHVVKSLNSSQLRTGLDARQHVEWLTGVSLNPGSHPRGLLGPELGGLLQKYISLSGEGLALALGRARDFVRQEMSTKLSTVRLTFDDIVLYEMLETERGSVNAPWISVAERLNTRFNATIFTSSQACKDRVDTLLQVFQGRSVDPSITLTSQQAMLLSELIEAKRSRTAFDKIQGSVAEDVSRAIQERLALSSAVTSSKVVGPKRHAALTTSATETALSVSSVQDFEPEPKRRRVEARDGETGDEEDLVRDHDTDEGSLATTEIFLQDGNEGDMSMNTIVFQVAKQLVPFCSGFQSKQDWWDAVTLEANKRLGLGVTFVNRYKLQAYIEKAHPKLYDTISLQEDAVSKSKPTMRVPTVNETPQSAHESTEPLPLTTKEASPVETSTDEPPQHAQGRACLSHKPFELGAEVGQGSLEAPVLPSREPSSQPLPMIMTNDGSESATTRRLKMLEQDRLEYGRQHQTLVDQLGAEHAAQLHESRAMLEAIERVRHDHRSEFVTMVNLIAQSLPP